MTDQEWLARRFEASREHLRAVAYRMLGSRSEADDAVQEAWLRLSRTDTAEVTNLAGWLTTVVSRVCLDMLRSRKSRGELSLEPHATRPPPGGEDGARAERDALLGDALGPALLVVLDTLSPPERVAFVLHDMFDLPFDEIALIVGRTPAAARQLASRARRRVRGAVVPADLGRQREIVEAFLAASREGDFEALLALLDPEVVLRADPAAVRAGAQAELRGAAAVAGTFAGRARFAEPALVDGAVGAVWAPGGRPRVVFGFTIAGGRILAIELLADPDRLGALALTPLEG